MKKVTFKAFVDNKEVASSGEYDMMHMLLLENQEDLLLLVQQLAEDFITSQTETAEHMSDDDYK